MTESDLIGHLRPTLPSPATSLRMTNFNMFGHCQPYIESRVPPGTTWDQAMELRYRGAVATIWMGDLNNEPIRAMSAISRKLVASGKVKAFVGGRWKGSGGIGPAGSRREGVYWLESGGEFLSIRLSWDSTKPTALNEAKALLDGFVLTAKQVP